jgi:hypothetical protein
VQIHIDHYLHANKWIVISEKGFSAIIDVE